MEVVVVFVAVPTTEDEHFVAADEGGGVAETGSWGAGAVWALVPGHFDGVEGVEVSEGSFLAGAFPTEYEDSGSGEDGGVTISWLRRSSFDLGFDPS